MFRTLCAIALFALGVGLASESHAQTSELAQNYIPTKPAKTLAPLTFEDSSHQTVDLTSVRGRYVLLNLWATWCSPCAQEMPSLNALQQQFDSSKFMVLPLNEDHEGHITATVFFMHAGIKYLPIYVDVAGHAPSILNVTGLPTSILLDPNGHEIGRVVGQIDWSSPDNIAFLRTLVTPPEPRSATPSTRLVR